MMVSGLRLKQILTFALALSIPPWTYAASSNAATPGKRKGRMHNTPDVEITPSGQLNVAEELNLYAQQGVTNTTVDYGVSPGWNVGFSVLNAAFYEAAAGTFWIEPDVLFNLERHQTLTQSLTLVVGTQTGPGFFHSGRVRLMDYTYVDGQWDHAETGTEIHLGGYYANAALAAARESTLGWHANVELPLLRDRLVLEGDYLSGKSSVAGATVKLTYAVNRHWQLAFGVQVPASHSGNDYSGLLGAYWSN